jgi:hypothetical protein
MADLREDSTEVQVPFQTFRFGYASGDFLLVFSEGFGVSAVSVHLRPVRFVFHRDFFLASNLFRRSSVKVFLLD